MRVQKELKKCFTAVMTIVLSIILFYANGEVGYATEEGESKKEASLLEQTTLETDLALPSSEELLANDNLLYLANCGTSTPDTAPTDSRMGLLQSNVDQAYGEDEETGTHWGYAEDEEYALYSDTTYDGTSLTDSKRYLNPERTYEAGKTGIYYYFECPEGTYEVTIGVYNTWSDRTADIVLEGETVEDGISLTQDTLVEETYMVEVTDGLLNVLLTNPDNSSTYHDPLINYIEVRVPTVCDKEYLQSAVDQVSLTEEEKAAYTPYSVERLQEVIDVADNMIVELTEDETAYTEERIQTVYEKLFAKQEGLVVLDHNENRYSSFSGTDGETWLDTDGAEIQAHGGQVTKFTTTDENGNEVTKWYWYGEDKTDGDYRVQDGGVRVYSSTDLYNWTDEGLALRNLTDSYDFEEPYFADLYGDYTEEEKENVLLSINDTTSVIERPKVIYNETTKQYVMWFHADGPTENSTSNYAAASAGVAVSDSPTGPFRFIDRYRLNYVDGAYDSDKGMARDMNLFVDDDGTAYIIYASEQNQTLIISKLNEEYTGLGSDPESATEGVDFLRIPCYVSASREAPAMFQYDGAYYLMTSGCDGWAANAATYAVCTDDTPLGTWTDMGNPCVTDTSVTDYAANITFGSQSTCIFAVDEEKGWYVYMGDRWNSSSPATNSLAAPKYVWLPVQITKEGEMRIDPYADWAIEDFENIGPITVNTELSVVEKDNLDSLPDTISITYQGETFDTAVTWTLKSGDLSIAGSPITVTGELAECDRSITVSNLYVASEELAYFIDCDTNSTILEQSEAYERLSAYGATELQNTVSDQAYEEDGWGYQTTGESLGQKALNTALSSSVYYTGYYSASNADSISYVLPLTKGDYQINIGQYEWWSTGNRVTEITASYVDKEGETKTVELGSVDFQANTKDVEDMVSGSISLDTDADVTITLTPTSTEAATIAWLSVEKTITLGDDVIWIDGETANTNEADSFHGLGLVSANNSSRLLLDYKEEQEEAYWDILNYLFNPEEGAGLNHIKIELGSDVNSSSGTEPASKRSAEETADATRGAGWMLAADAKTINPDISVDFLRWGEPEWVTKAFEDGEEVGYAARYQWFKETIDAVYDTYGLQIDYVSADQNETGSANVDSDWIIYLAAHLENETEERYDYGAIQIVASDEVGSRQIAVLMLENEELRNAVDVITIHYSTQSDSNMLTLNEEYGKEIWYSEGGAATTEAELAAEVDGSGLTGIYGVLDIANRFINSYYNGKMTRYEYQPAVSAYYDGTKYFPKQLITANEPWSGNYRVDAGVWTTAHFMQFIESGWQYIDSACYGDGTESTYILPDSSTNNYITLKDPDTDDYSMVIVNDSSAARAYKIAVKNLSTALHKVNVWETAGPQNEAESYDANYFQKIETITPEAVSSDIGYYTITVKPYSMVTITTKTDAGNQYEAQAPDTSVLTLPYTDDFEYQEYENEYLENRGDAPRYTTDQGGAFEVVEGENNTLEQKITWQDKPTDWYMETLDPYTVLGDDSWVNYSVSLSFLLDTETELSEDYENYASLGARHLLSDSSSSVYSRSGYSILVFQDGTYELTDGTSVVDSGTIAEFDAADWHTAKVVVNGNVITAYLDGTVISTYTDTDSKTLSGKVSIGSGYYLNQFDDLKVEPINQTVSYLKERLDDCSAKLVYSASGWEKYRNIDYYEYNRTKSIASTEKIQSIAFTDTTSEQGTLNAYYYYKPSGDSWGSNSSNTWSGEEGSYYEIAFEGVGIDLYGVCNSSNGTADIYLDDALYQEDVSFYSDSSTTNTICSITGLNMEQHTVRVVWKSKYISAAGALVDQGDIDEKPSVSYTFEGTGFQLVGKTDDAILNVYVDEELVAENVSTGETQSRDTSYTYQGLENGSHSFQVVVVSGDYTLDSVEILGDIATVFKDMNETTVEPVEE